MGRTLDLTLAVRGSVSGPLVDAWRYRPAAPTGLPHIGAGSNRPSPDPSSQKAQKHRFRRLESRFRAFPPP